jgi:hypothetical protein
VWCYVTPRPKGEGSRGKGTLPIGVPTRMCLCVSHLRCHTRLAHLLLQHFSCQQFSSISRTNKPYTHIIHKKGHAHELPARIVLFGPGMEIGIPYNHSDNQPLTEFLGIVLTRFPNGIQVFLPLFVYCLNTMHNRKHGTIHAGANAAPRPTVRSGTL